VDEFQDRVTLHRLFADAANPVLRGSASTNESKLRARLVARATQEALAMVHGLRDGPEQTDALDAMLDQYVIDPNRRAIARRTVALERWLADHGYQSGNPIRFAHDSRDLRYHNSRLALPMARPVSANGHRADSVVERAVRSAMHRTPAATAFPRAQVSVVPGFVLLELSPVDFASEFALPESADAAVHHVAFGAVPAGSGMTMTRDVSGEVLAHALTRQYAHELASLSEHAHLLHIPTPHEFAAHPERGWQLPFSAKNARSVDGIAHQVLAQRLTHLPESCRATHALTFSDLGFTPSDWVNLSDRFTLDPLTRQVATLYLGSLLLGAVLIEALNDHPDALDTVGMWPEHALDTVECHDATHGHYRAAHRYANFMRSAQSNTLSPKLLDGIYHRSVLLDRDFAHNHSTSRPVRLHVYRTPLHIID